MPSPLHLIGHHAARRFLNLKLGWELMRDPHVPVGKKGAALLIGAGITIILIVLEVPLEFLVGAIAPLVGIGADLFVDGAELFILPLLIATAIMPYLVRQPADRAMIRVRPSEPNFLV